MITAFFLNLVVGILTPIVGLLPSGSGTVATTTAGADGFRGLLGKIDAFIPIGGPLSLLAFMLVPLLVFVTVRLFVSLWKLVKW